MVGFCFIVIARRVLFPDEAILQSIYIQDIHQKIASVPKNGGSQ